LSGRWITIRSKCAQAKWWGRNREEYTTLTDNPSVPLLCGGWMGAGSKIQCTKSVRRIFESNRQEEVEAPGLVK
jgi:hypothetical protein